MDWILLGLISTDAVTGEYSFAYRAFELSRLPIFIIAPIILSFFSRLLAGSAVMKEETQSKVNMIFIAGAFLSVFIPLSLNILWSPVMNELFDGKYGSTNSIEFLLLSACLPLQFFINISWTICFASKKYKQISFITVITAISNLALNLVFIKLMGGQGAAIAFLLTTILQMLLYYNQVRHIVTRFPIQKFILLMIVAAISYYVSISVTDNLFLQLLIVVAGYTSVSFLLKLINKANFTAIQLLLKK
jgi:O-antigen/teichoic acid export membrane protein